jgi:hypothetical protein
MSSEMKFLIIYQFRRLITLMVYIQQTYLNSRTVATGCEPVCYMATALKKNPGKLLLSGIIPKG